MDGANPKAEKLRLRAAMRKIRAGRTADQHERLSAAVCLHLRTEEEFGSARSIHAYWPMIHRGEVDIRPLLLSAFDEGRTVWLPVVDGDALTHRRFRGEDDLRPGTFGQLEPGDEGSATFSWPDIIIVPGLAADNRGNRLGYGGGYYDRFLSDAPPSPAGPRLIMALFEEQIVESVPRGPHDIPVDFLVSENGIRRCFH